MNTPPDPGGPGDPPASATLLHVGWDPAGGKVILEDIAALRDDGFRPGAAAAEILAQVSGLHVTRPAQRPRRKARTFHFDVIAMPPNRWLRSVEMATVDADDDLCLVGELSSERMFLAADPKGNIYAGNGSRLYYLGDSVGAALETLMSHTGLDDWPRVVAPPVQPWPILKKADPPREITTPEAAAAIALTAWSTGEGPVIGVADLGDVWRVFRSADTDLMRPPLVPQLVAKDTGDVIHDLPLRQEGPSAQDGYAKLLAGVDRHLRDMGFVGSRPRWRYASDDRHAVLKFERHDASRASLIFRFCLSLGDAKSDQWPRCWSSTTVGGTNVQFHVLAGVSIDPMVDAVVQKLRSEAMPLLENPSCW